MTTCGADLSTICNESAPQVVMLSFAMQRTVRSGALIRSNARYIPNAARIEIDSVFHRLSLALQQNQAPVRYSSAVAGVVQWQNGSFPSFIRGFDSLHPLHQFTDQAFFGREIYADALIVRRFGGFASQQRNTVR